MPSGRVPRLPAIRPVTANEADVVVACGANGGARYHVSLHLRFDPAVDVNRLRRALQDTVDRHPRLRSGFRRQRGELVRCEFVDAPVVVDEGPASGVIAPDERSWAVAVAALPFSLDAAPLIRCHLRRSSAGDLVVLVAHHVVCDGWTARCLADEVVRRYLGEELRATGDALDPGDPVEGSTTEVPGPSTREVTDAAAFWEAQAGGEPLAPLPDFVRDSDNAALGRADGSVRVPITAEVLTGIRAAAAAWRTSPALLGFVAWQLALHAWAGRREGYSFLVFAGRSDHEHHAFGHFARALPLASCLEPTRLLPERVRQATNLLLDSLEHAHAEAADVMALAGVRPSGAAVYLHARDEEQSWSGPHVTVRREEEPSGNAKFGFSAAFIEGERDGVLHVDFDATLYRTETAARVAAQVMSMLGELAGPDRSRWSELDLLLACDEPSLRFGGAASHDSVVALVRERVKEHPDAPALRVAGEASAISYHRLWQEACALAAAINAHAVGSGPVALALHPAPRTFVTWLGVLLAGRPYLPLDPAFPDAQLRAILELAGPSLVVSEPEVVRRISALFGAGSGAVTLSLPQLVPESRAGERPAAAEPVLPSPTAPMCVLYTSGSTGVPKGVVLSQRGLARLMQPEFLKISAKEVFSQLSPLNFDGAAYEVWGALAHGACLVVVDKETLLDPGHLRTVVRAEGVTTMLMTTPLLNRVVEDAPDLLQSLRRVYFGGELVSVHHVRRAIAHGGPGRLVHSYGPTENSFTSTCHVIDEVDAAARTVPIGAPVPGTSAVVLMEGTRIPAPVGMPGELVLGGVGVAEGYLGDPERTAESFIDLDDIDPRLGGRGYRTGDRVRLLATGELEFLGRWDNQVKIRSQRVEMGEVEHVLRSHPEVGEVVVTATGTPKDLVAYCVTRRPSLTDVEVREHAKQRLPRFAVPRHIVLLKQMPLRPNGKIDRSRLPSPAAIQAAPSAPPVPTGPDSHGRDLAACVQAAWVDVLGRQDPASDENFFDAGGNSLMLVSLQQRILERTGRLLSVGQLMRFASIQAQARALEDSTRGTVPTREPAVEQAVDPPRPPTSWRALRISAASPRALDDARAAVADVLDRGADAPPLGDVAHTLDVGRDRFPHRCVILTDTPSAGVDALRNGGPLTVTGIVLRQPPLVVITDDSAVTTRLEVRCRGRQSVLRRAGLSLPVGGEVAVEARRVSWEGGLVVRPDALPIDLHDAWLTAQLWCLGVELPLGDLVDGRRIRLPLTRRHRATTRNLEGVVTG